jgi:hypothetical protein
LTSGISWKHTAGSGINQSTNRNRNRDKIKR